MFKNSIKVLTVAAAAAALVACGGGSDGFIAKDKEVTIDQNTGPKVLAANQAYTFPDGLFGLTDEVKITMDGSGGATLESGGNSSSANFAFGSCVFSNVTPDFGDLKAAGGTFPCSVVYTKPGQSAKAVETVLKIDGKTSKPFTTQNVKVSGNDLVVGGQTITGGGN